MKLNKRIVSTVLVLVLLLLELTSVIPVFAQSATAEIAVGDYIFLGHYQGEQLIWRCVDIDANGPLMLLSKTIPHKAFSASQTGMQTDDLSEITDFSDSEMRNQYGSNRWSVSTLRQWLNSEADSVSWEYAVPSAELCYGNRGYDWESGFLSDGNFTAGEKYVMKSVAQKNILSHYDEEDATGGSVGLETDYESVLTNEVYETAFHETLVDRVFCLDAVQFEKARSFDAKFSLPSLPNEQYWLRTPLYEKSYAVNYATVYTVAIDTVANNSEIGVRPAFYINPDALNIESGTGKKESPFVIFGSEPVKMENIVLSETALTLGTGMKHQLTAEIFPTNANDKTLVWRSENEAIASVANDGTITAKAVGNAEIIVSSVDETVSASCTVTVTERVVVNFSDSAFKQAVIDECFSGERELSDPIYADEVSAVKELDISNQNITELQGIEYFTALENLNCSGNQLRELKLSEQKNLKILDCTNAQLLSFDISANPKLTHLYCAQNNISYLDLSLLKDLIWLDCSNNNVTELTLSSNEKLEYLYVMGNALETVDIQNLKNLKSFECQNNRLTALDLSGNSLLTNLNCSNNRLTELHLTSQKNLKQLLLKENRLKTMDLSANTKLTYCDCSRNYFESKNDISGLNESRTTLVYYPQYLVLIPAESVKLSQEALRLKVGETAVLTVEVLPQGATNKSVKWSCDNTAVANISESGRVTAYAPGQCIITVTTDDGGYTDTCMVEVLDTEAPGIADKLNADYVTGSGVKISFQPATDNVRILRYDIYRNDTFLKSVSETFFVDNGLEENKEYRYQIVAVDTSENKSEMSSSISIVPKSPKINRILPANGDTFGGDGTQRISVYYNNTNNSTDAALVISGQNAEGVWVPVSFPFTCSQGKSGSSNVLYAEFSKEVLKSGDYQFRFTVLDKDKHADFMDVWYTVDRTAPQVVEDLAAMTGEENITLSWATARDADVVRYEVYRAGTLNGTYQLYGTVYGRTNTEFVDHEVFVNEVYYYKVLAVDAFEQKGELTDAVCGTSTKDESIPTVTKFLPANNTKINAVKNIQVTAEDNIQVAKILLQYSVNETDWVNYAVQNTAATANFSFVTTDFSDGDIWLRAIAYDFVGNESNGRPVYNYTIDNTGPFVVTGLKKVAATATTMTLSWNDVADQDFSHFVVEKKEENGAYTQAGTTSTTLGINLYNLVPNTEYTYRVVAYDTLGNRGVASEDITVSTENDTTAPVITGISPGANRFAVNVPMRITAGDDYLVDKLDVEYSYDLIQWVKEAQLIADPKRKENTFNYQLNLQNKNEGSLYVRPIAYDMAGNHSDDTEKAPFVEYYVDRTPPAKPEGLVALSGNGYIELKWKQGEEQDTAGYMVYRSVQVDGDYELVRNGLKQINYIDKNIQLGQNYYYKIAVSDIAGNISPLTEYVAAKMLEDKEAPVVYSFSPSNGYVISKNTPLNILAGDNHKVVSVTLEYLADGETWTVLETKSVNFVSGVVSFSVNRDFFTDGQHSFRAIATDESGNTGEYSSVYSYTIDTLAPIVSNVGCIAGEESVTVTWQSAQESDLSGFYIYRRTEGSGYSKVGSVSNKNQKEYSYTNYNLNASVKYQYQVVAVDTNGNQSIADSEWIYPLEKEPEEDTIPPGIAMNIVTVMEVGVEEYFDASASGDNVGITSYHWDFGDGNFAHKAKAAHSYQAAGAYTVTLTLADAAGNRSVKTALIKVEERKHIGSVTVQVKDTYGNPVSGAGVYFNLGAEDVSIYGTNTSGQVVIREYEGIYPVGVYADGYLPAKINVQIIKNTNDKVYHVTIEKKEIVVGELTHTRMTLDEIIAAGIDPYKPENQNIYKFEIVLTYGTEKYTASGITTNTSDPIKLQVHDTPDYVKRDVYVWNYYGGGGGGGIGGSYVRTPQTIIAVVELPGEASWLKEFFDVHLHVENQASEEFAIDDCKVTLNYPSNALTLMTGVVDKYSETKTVNIGTLAGQSDYDVHWILRGDVAGEYDISADFTGTLRDFNETINATFKAAEPIKVYGSENLFLDIHVEDTIAAFADTAIRVGLTNEGVVDVYLPNVKLYDLTELRRFKTNQTSIVKDDFDVLRPGESLWVDYVIPRSINETLLTHIDKEFYLYSAVVNQLGGNVTLKHRFNVVPAYTISPDMIYTYTKDASGVLTPVDLVEITRLKTKVPEIVVKTFSLNKDMEYVPTSRELTITDDHLIKKKEKLSITEEINGASIVKEVEAKDGKYYVKTNDEGTLILNGYEMRNFKTKDTYHISIASPRAVTKKIPVVTHDFMSETAAVKGRVYYDDGKTRTPIEKAEVTLSDKVTETNKNGEFEFKYIPTGENNIVIQKDGYTEVHSVVSVEADKTLDFYLNRIADENAPHIKFVQFTQFSTKNGNVTVFPEGSIEGSLQFILGKELKNEQFVQYKYYITSENGLVKVSGDFYSDVYSMDLSEMKAGDRLYFSLITRDQNGNTKESGKYNTNIIIAKKPGILAGISLFMNDLGAAGNFKEVSLIDKDLSVLYSEEDKMLVGQSLFETAWIKTDDSDVIAASEVLQGLKLDTKKKQSFPLKAEYNVDGTLKISFGYGATYNKESSYYKSVGNYLGYFDHAPVQSSDGTFMNVFDVSKKSEYSVDKALGIGGDAKLEFIIKYDEAKSDWKATLDITLSGKVEATVFRVQVPVVYGVAGGYGDLALGGNAEATWQCLSGYLEELDIIESDFSLLPTALKGGVHAKFGVGAYALDKDIASAGGYAKLSADVHLIPQQKLVLGYDFGLEGKVLFWEPNKSLLKDSVEIRAFDTDTPVSTGNMLSLLSVEEEGMQVVKIPEGKAWNGSQEKLTDNVFDGSKPVMVPLSDEKIMMVFADYAANRDANNPIQLYYSIYENGTWSQPKALHDDGTVDLYPCVYADANGNVSVAWINFSEAISNADGMTMSEIRNEIYPKMTVAVSRYQADTDSWTTPVTVNREAYLKKGVQIASDDKNTITAWIQNPNNQEYGFKEAPDSIGYSINGTYQETGVLELSGRVDSLAVATDNNVVYVSYIREENGVNKAFYRWYGGKWSPEIQMTENAYNDRFLRSVIAEDTLYLYYTNGEKIYRMNCDTQKSECVVVDESIQTAIDFECLNNGDVIWLSNCDGGVGMFLAQVGNGLVRAQRLETKADSLASNVFAVSQSDGMLMGVMEKYFNAEETKNALYVRKQFEVPELKVSNITYDTKLIPGIASNMNITVKNNGLQSSKGFKIYYSSDESKENAFQEGEEYKETLVPGQEITVITESVVKSDYHNSEVYILLEDSNGNITASKHELIYDKVEIANFAKDSNIPEQMNFRMNVDNYGFVDYQDVKLVVTDKQSGSVLASKTLGALNANSSMKAELEVALNTEEQLCEVQIFDGEQLLCSQLADVISSDYSVLLGDYHCDGQVNPTDATALLQRIAYGKNDDERRKLAGDITGDEALAPNDVIAILQYCAGLISNFR